MKKLTIMIILAILVILGAGIKMSKLTKNDVDRSAMLRTDIQAMLV
jgi:hypothetical protein